MIRKTFILLLLLAIASASGFLAAKTLDSPFESLSSEEMRQKIIAQRDFAIQKAIEAGVYKCCITPPCTMCYMEDNPWNNQTAGTCACDDLIAVGKEPCPQCKAGLCETDENGACETSSFK